MKFGGKEDMITTFGVSGFSDLRALPRKQAEALSALTDTPSGGHLLEAAFLFSDTFLEDLCAPGTDAASAGKPLARQGYRKPSGWNFAFGTHMTLVT